MKPEQDEVLVKLRDAMDPIISEIDENFNVERAVFIIGTKEVLSADGEYEGTQTYLDVAGDLGLIQESLSAELKDLIAAGNPALFQALREVIRSIEEDLEIEDGTPLLSPHESRTLH